MMKHIAILCCLILAASAGPKDQKTTLEDIERDYLANEKMTKLSPPSPPKATSPAPSPSQYGFVPTKTLADYIQREPKPQYVQQQYVQQQYVKPQYVTQVQYQQPDYSQYTTSQQNAQVAPQKYTTSFKQYSSPQYNSPQYISPQYSSPQYSRAQQKYALSSTPSAQQTYRYVPQEQTQYQGYENVQYITDNSIGQDSQQYYTPQYVYLQPYTSPSTAVQTVVDPKGGVQYVMYIPAYVQPAGEQAQNYENVVYTPTTAQEPSSPTYQVTDTPQTSQKEQIQYVQPKSKYTKAEFVIKREPKSLLDSYVPSYLQVQYYNQAQQNSIQEPVKVSQAARVKNVKSSYKSVESAGDETSPVYRYQPVSVYKS